MERSADRRERMGKKVVMLRTDTNGEQRKRDG